MWASTTVYILKYNLKIKKPDKSKGLEEKKRHRVSFSKDGSATTQQKQSTLCISLYYVTTYYLYILIQIQCQYMVRILKLLSVLFCFKKI